MRSPAFWVASPIKDSDTAGRRKVWVSAADATRITGRSFGGMGIISAVWQQDMGKFGLRFRN